MGKEFRELQPDEVISQKGGQKFFKDLRTFTLQEAVIALRDSLAENNLGRYFHWISPGVSCEVLTPGDNWRTGKVKISLVFCPDEVEADEPVPKTETSEEAIEYPLDEIRRSLNTSDETP